ncbi:hypothetical protein MICA_215 [Micavibrio aeruginosavorus ARL-13]|uniref:Uncharacterized protein n=1 Tax=Micavibrio aeruginosavorus (strain ARL-13) TaxID=856793 RepID=G2KP53_MICAA|nr:hypothetical protein MICA_215 [Micavibrio aeruginosavorus ARL-13]
MFTTKARRHKGRSAVASPCSLSHGERGGVRGYRVDEGEHIFWLYSPPPSPLPLGGGTLRVSLCRCTFVVHKAGTIKRPPKRTPA